MSLARFMKMIGAFALIVGIIALLLPGKFIYFPQIEDFLTKFGDALFKGISANPAIKLFIAKAPALLMCMFGVILLFWGYIRGLKEAQKPDKKKIMDEKAIQHLIEMEKAKGKS